MQFKKKLNTNNEKKSAVVPETVSDDDLSLSDDVSSFVSDEDLNENLGGTFVAPEL